MGRVHGLLAHCVFDVKDVSALAAVLQLEALTVYVYFSFACIKYVRVYIVIHRLGKYNFSGTMITNWRTRVLYVSVIRSLQRLVLMVKP